MKKVFFLFLIMCFFATFVGCDKSTDNENTQTDVETGGNHIHEFGAEWKSDKNTHYHQCICGAKKDQSEHIGGVATENERAKCEVCGVAYGSFGTEDIPSDGGINETIYKIVIADIEYDVTLNEQTDKTDGRVAEYVLYDVDVFSSDVVFVTANDIELVNIGADSGKNNNVCGNGETGMKIVKSGRVTIYFKVYDDGYSLWITGNEDNDTNSDNDHYTLELNGTSYNLVENTETDKSDGRLAEYMVLGVPVTSGDSVVVKLDGQQIIKIGPDNGSNLTTDMTIITTCESADFYVKVWTDGGYSIWISGLNSSSSDGGNSGALVTVYLKPAIWNVDDAWYWIHAWNNSGSSVDLKMDDNDADGVYEVTFDGSYTHIIFVRSNPESTTPGDWDKKWNQTADLIVPTDGKNLYTITGWGESKGSWSTK